MNLPTSTYESFYKGRHKRRAISCSPVSWSSLAGWGSGKAADTPTVGPGHWSPQPRSPLSASADSPFLRRAEVLVQPHEGRCSVMIISGWRSWTLTINLAFKSQKNVLLLCNKPRNEAPTFWLQISWRTCTFPKTHLIQIFYHNCFAHYTQVINTSSQCKNVHRWNFLF